MEKFKFSQITKYYGKKLVLDNTELEVPYGEIAGVLGLNGAGKTTLFNCLVSVTDNKKGIRVFESKNEYSYMSKLDLYDYQAIAEIIYINKNIYQNFNAVYAVEMFKECGIRTDKSYNTFSLGQKNLIDFIIAVSRECRLYILDEPLSNVDISVRKYIKRKIIEKSSSENIFLISTHDTEDFENIFSGVTILYNNKLTEYTGTEKLRERGISVNEFYLDTVKRGENA